MFPICPHSNLILPASHNGPTHNSSSTRSGHRFLCHSICSRSPGLQPCFLSTFYTPARTGQVLLHTSQLSTHTHTHTHTHTQSTHCLGPRWLEMLFPLPEMPLSLWQPNLTVPLHHLTESSKSQVRHGCLCLDISNPHQGRFPLGRSHLPGHPQHGPGCTVPPATPSVTGSCSHVALHWAQSAVTTQ